MDKPDLLISRLNKLPVWGLILLQVITLGLFEIYWLYAAQKTLDELQDNDTGFIKRSMPRLAFLFFAVILKFVFILSDAITEQHPQIPFLSLLIVAIHVLFFGAVSLRILDQMEKTIEKPFSHSVFTKKTLSFLFGLYYLQHKVNTFRDSDTSSLERRLYHQDKRHLLLGALVVLIFSAINIKQYHGEPGKTRAQLDHMLPTLNATEEFFVNEKAYPRFSDIGYGDLVYISTGADKRGFTSRVIGLPGDSIEIQEGIVIVNGLPVKQEKSKFPLPNLPPPYNKSDIEIYDETLKGKTYQVLYFNKASLAEQPRNWALPDKATVGENSVFALGDFRDIAIDSRSAYSVHYEYIRGRVSETNTSYSNKKMEISH